MMADGPVRRQRPLLHFAFRLLYNELALIYDPVSWIVSLGQWRNWQRAALPFLDLPADRPGRVLELAHGPGHMLLALAQAGHEVIGLDLSPAMSRAAARRLRRAGLASPRPGLVRGRAEALPLAPASVDAVLATFPAEFILDPRTLAAVRRALRPAGRFVLVPMARLRGTDPASRALEWLYHVTGQRGDGAGTATFAASLSAAGFAASAHAVPLGRSEVIVVRAVRLP